MKSPFLDSDYQFAVVQIAWLLNDQTRHLIFAAVELHPSELSKTCDEPEVHFKAPRIGRRARVYFRRYVMSAEEGRLWYDSCRLGRVTLPEPNKSVQLIADQLFEEPAWPALIIGDDFPFFGDVACTTRTHHLYTKAKPAEIARLFQLHPEALQWVSDRLFVSLARHPELVGSVHLLAPNPVLRSVHHRLGVAQDSIESSRIHLITRKGYSGEKLSLILTEHRPSGISAIHQIAVDQPYLTIPHANPTDRVELMVICPQRGLLEWHKPTGFVRSIHIKGNLIGATREINVPAKDGNDTEVFEVSQVEKGWSNVLGEASSDESITTRLRSLEQDRRRTDEAERLGQKWFHGNREEAIQFIRGLIKSARERVWIIDPYFATIEVFSFALATAYSEVQVVILTSGPETLQKPDEVNPQLEAGESLLMQISRIKEASQITVRVMTGKPAVHDRFLVIDDKVWLSGNSLNSIGERAGMMIALPEPTMVLRNLEAVINDQQRTKDLATWVSARKAAKSS